jgi:hypothetical protein
MIRRVERLEQTIGRAAEYPHVCNIVFVDSEGKVTSSLILEPGKPNRWTEGSTDSEVLGRTGRTPG